MPWAEESYRPKRLDLALTLNFHFILTDMG